MTTDDDHPNTAPPRAPDEGRDPPEPAEADPAKVERQDPTTASTHASGTAEPETSSGAAAGGRQVEVPPEADGAEGNGGKLDLEDVGAPLDGEPDAVQVTLDGDDADASEPRVLAAIPAYNEEVAIGSVVLQAREHATDVLVVDDGSADRTADLAEEAGAEVIAFEENHGKGYAVQAAFEVARMGGYDAVVLLDGDGQHLPEQIPDLVDPVIGRGPHEDDPVDMTVGLRFGDNTEMPLYRRFGKRVLDYATAFASTATSGRPEGPTDSQTGFRAFNARAIETMAGELQGNGFGIESEQIVVAEENGLETASVAITCRYDGLDTSTSGPVRHALGVLEHMVKLMTMKRPLLFMGLPSIALIVAGGGLGIYVLQYWNWTGYFSVPKAMGAGFLVLLGMLGTMSSLILNIMGRFEKKGDRTESGGRVSE